MAITDYGFFSPSFLGGVFLYKNQKGEDWYDIRMGLTRWEKESGNFIDAIFPTWATASQEGVILNVEFDPSKLVPDNRTVLGISDSIDTVTPGMIYSNGKISPAPPTTLPQSYSIPKSLPWRRMTEDEAVAVTEAMAKVTPRQRAIYDASQEISNQDELYSVLFGLLSSALTPSRAKELLERQ